MKFFNNFSCRHVVATASAIVLFSIAISVFISSCNRKTMTAEEASEWIAAYPPAHIDKDSRIRIELTYLSSLKIDTNLVSDKIFKFSPKIKGTVNVSENRRYIDFIPEKSMKQGRKYNCRLKMNEITGIKDLADFAFEFYVDKRKIKFEDVKVIVDPDNTSMMTIIGKLRYNVSAAGDKVTSDSTIIVCDYPGAKVEMNENAVEMCRGFKIKGIKRHDNGRTLKLTTNHIDGFSVAEYTLKIPSVSDFVLLDAERVEASEPYINLEFSTPLSSRQELEGLITIDNINDLRIERNGANVKVYYPKNAISDLTLRISDVLKNIDGKSLEEEVECHFEQEVIPPAIEIPFEGSILPDNANLKLPFRAVNLMAVDVEVVKIYPSNVISFIQENNIDGTSMLRRFGRLIYHSTVRLDKDKSLDLHQWQNFSIDLKKLFTQEFGAVYNIRLTFRKAYSLYDKSGALAFEEIKGVSEDEKKEWDIAEPYIYREAPDYDWSQYDWQEVNDPSTDSYYIYDMGRMPEINLIASNLGLIVKRANENEVKAVVTNILTANPMGRIQVTAYNYQLQKIGSGISDGNGFADFKTDGIPYMVTATDGRSTTYLKVRSGYELSTSNFDVSGKKLIEGIKGFTYGERGVWRPGDEIHLTLIVEDKNKKLPENHPVVMELYNPSEQLYARQTLTKSIDGFYVFNITTEENVPTGLWEARFKVGNEKFYHPVRIETIKPNRLKINITSPQIIRANNKERIGIDAHWLTGPAAKNLSATVEMTLYTNPTPFGKYGRYTFKNPLVSYTSSQKDLYSGTLDSLGRILRSCIIGADINSPGMLKANVTAKVTEPGGDASIATKSVSFSPFGVYVGIDLGARNYETDEDIKFPVVVLNQEGSKLKVRDLEYKIYRLDWDWWWEGGPSDLSRYVQSVYADVVANGTVTVINGASEIPFKVEYPDWGKYLVLVRDIKGGHATGGVVTVDWPYWRGRSSKSGASGSTELSFTLDKPKYNVGETANIYLPKCEGGKVLLSIENGSQVLKKMWVTLSGKDETKYSLHIDKDMSPNFYVSATMLRPHCNTDFDTPVRLFGVQSAIVINPASVLHPEIDMPEELHPQGDVTVKIKERDNRPMTYTLAIVDEGLLDITNYKTPHPWMAMNQKDALGVRTWDMFNDVIGAFGTNFRTVMSIGGDEALRKAAGKDKRFNPVVKFMGPFTLKSGTQIHNISLPNYVGSVRVMVVAAHNSSYGCADKTVKVTSPLMLLTTLPRTLACCDTLNIPVNVFAMDKVVKNVAVNIETSGPVMVSGTRNRNIAFSEQDEQLVNFKLVCDKAKEGKARIVIKASGGGYTTQDTTYIEVSNPMPNVLETVEKTLQAGRSENFTVLPINGGSALLQIASVPVLNYKGVSLFMESYPHLCTEQLSSKALFMLYGRKFLDEATIKKSEKALPQIIKAVQARQLHSGGFAYWPGQLSANDWVTSLAGLALTEASRQGYKVDNECLSRWRKYQEMSARDYRYTTETDLDQAYRLYSLAVAESPLTSAMNRLRESKKLSQAASYCLASAYAETGRTDVALKLIERAEHAAEQPNSAQPFYSDIRDKAIELEAYTLCENTAKALPAARKIAVRCSGANYVTQDIAFATVAMSKLSEMVGNGSVSVKISEHGKTPISISDIGNLRTVSLTPQSGKVLVENRGNSTLELSLLMAYQPAPDTTISPVANGVKVIVNYIDTKGMPISVTRLKQDTEFRAKIAVTGINDMVDNMALTYIVPSGWEIWNDRLYDTPVSDETYCDIRDNSCRFYFALKRGETKTYEVRLRAAYQGKYLLPPTVCEDMYNPACRAMTTTQRTVVF